MTAPTMRIPGRVGSANRMLSLLLAAAIVLLAGTGQAKAQPNDDCALATVVAGLPFHDTIDTTTATSDPADPTPTCGYTTDTSVWYAFTAPKNLTIEIRTTGSSYDTTIAVHTGTCGAIAAELACNDDDLVSLQSELLVSVEKGTDLLVEVVGNAGGTLDLEIVESASRFARPKFVQDVVRGVDASPLGGTVGDLDAPMVLSGKDVAYASTQALLIANVGGVPTTVVAVGDASPVGGTFGDIREPATNGLGHAAFYAELVGTTASDGIFLWDGTTISALALAGAPSPDGGTYVAIDRGVAINDAGEVAFGADRGLYLYSGGSSTLLGERGDPTSCGGDVFQFFARPTELHLSNAGQVAVAVRASGIGSRNGIYLYDALGTQQVACEGDPAPGGGIFSELGRGSAVNSSGLVLFEARTTSPVGRGVYSWTSVGGPALQLAEGNVIASGETLDGLAADVVLALNDAFDAAFAVRGLVARALGGVPLTAAVALAKNGDPCPTGGTFTGVASGESASIDASGNVAFDARCDGGAGAYLAPVGGGAIEEIFTTVGATSLGSGFTATQPQLTAAGDAVVRATRLSVLANRCASASCAVAAVVASPSDPSPGLPGEHIEAINRFTAAGAAKRVAFVATNAGSTRVDSIVAWRRGNSALVVTDGAATPDGLGTYTGLDTGERLGVGRRGIVFGSPVSHPNGSFGLYLANRGGIEQLAMQNDPSPAGGVFQSFERWSIGRRDVAFFARDSIANDCVFSAQGPGLFTRIACAGDPAPASVGGTLSYFDGAVVAGARGVFFHVAIDFGAADECLFFGDGTMLEPVVCSGDLLEGGGYVSAFSSLGTTGLVAPGVAGGGLLYAVDDGESLTQLLAARKGVTTIVAEPQAPIPTTAGGTYGFFFPAPLALDRKIAAFVTGLDGEPYDALLRARIR